MNLTQSRPRFIAIWMAFLLAGAVACRAGEAKSATLADSLGRDLTRPGPKPEAPPPPPDNAAAALASYLAANGRAASISKTLVIKYATEMAGFHACTGTLLQTSQSSVLSDAWDLTVDFRYISPDVEVAVLDSATGLQTTKLVSSSGEMDIPASRLRPRMKPGEKVPGRAFIEIVFADKPTADTAAVLLRQTIAACGGRRRSPQAVAIAKAREDSSRASSRRLLGEDIPAEEKANLTSMCHDRVRAQLRAPSSAKFDDEVNATQAQDGGILMFGHVDAQNGFGGFKELTYLCSFDKYGKRYIPKSATVL